MSDVSEDEELPIASDNEAEDGDDLFEGMADDYRNIEVLDQYDSQAIDNAEYAAMDAMDRRAAERMLDERDRREGRRRSAHFMPSALDDVDDFGAITLEQRRELLRSQGLAISDEDVSGVNIDDFQGDVRAFLEEEAVKTEVKRRFNRLLTECTYLDTSELIYRPKITEMCKSNACSLVVSYTHLSTFEASMTLAIWFVDCPSQMITLFEEVAMDVVRDEFPDYSKIHPRIHVRMCGLSLTDPIRDLREMHLNGFVQVTGVVTRRTNVLPQLLLVKFDCLKCGFIIGPITQVAGSKKEVRPPMCPDCESKGPFRMNEAETVYRNFQKLVLQEPPGSVPAGRIPRSREVILTDDLVDSVRPGEQITVTGIYKHVFEAAVNALQGFPVFNTVIEANHVSKEKDFLSEFLVTDTDKAEILRLSKLPDIEQRIINSIAPSIYGYNSIKRGIAYALFGGREKRHPSGHRVRGDINMLILGDPGVAKSQFLRYVENVACRAVYATGKGASAVGLTASVRRDPVTREWTLEGGALVLADRGVCLIDEFDKMNEKDRTSIHEAMEQQSISISKAGIVATLQARCAVIAAANPLKGRYDGTLTFRENVDLTEPILSRFDVLSVVRDRVDPIRDEQLADFVVSSHMASHPELMKEWREQEELEDARPVGENQLSQAMLRKYIVFAKNHCHPRLDHIDRKKITNFYADLRDQSFAGGGLSVATRHLESVLRCAEARAKVHLRDYVNEEDVDVAIGVMLESFIATQKQSVQASLNGHFRHYLNLERDPTELLLHVLEEEVLEEITHRRLVSLGSGADSAAGATEEPVEISRNEFERRAKELNSAGKLSAFYKSARFRQEGYSLAARRTKIVKTFA